MTSSTLAKRLLLIGAVILMVGGLGANWSSVRNAGVDFPSLYVMGRGIVTGSNIYAPEETAVFPERYHVERPMGMFYPPATGFTMAPFALFPYELGKLLWFLTMELVLVLGIRSMVRVAAPRADNYLWMLCVGIVTVSSGLRWGMILLQGAPLVLGLLCWFVAALHGDKPRLAAALAIVAVAVKMTLAVPFLGLLLLQRRFFAAAASLGTWVLLNALGFARMGSSALKDYRQSVAGLEAIGNINSPDPWNVRTSPRLDWTSLFYGVSGKIGASRLAALALSGLVVLWLLREGLRVRPPLTLRTTALFLAPLTCLGCLCVYHHHYDACLFFAPLLLWCFVFGRQLLRMPSAWLLLPLVLMILFLPFGVAQRVANSVLGFRGIGLLKLSFPVALSCALLGSLLVLAKGGNARSAASVK